MKELSPFPVLYEGQRLGPISGLTFSSKAFLAIGCEGATVWGLSRQEVPGEPLAFFPGAFMPPVAWSPDEKSLASSALNGHVAVWNQRGEILYHTGCRTSRGMGVRQVAWWRDLLAVADEGGHVALSRVSEIGGVSYE